MAAAFALLQSKRAHAAASEPAIGLQLYSVRSLLPKDFGGTLQQVAAAGFRNVEAAGFYDHSAAEVKQMMSAAGLKCVSAHYSLGALLKAEDDTIAYAKALGLEYVICSSPSVADPSRFEHAPGGAWQAMLHSMTADDWKWNAQQFNRIGKKVKAEGMKFGYHNHTMEFRDVGGTFGLEVLLKETDPSLVTFEMDCAWVVAGGANPVDLLSKYPTRFRLLHVKDLKPADPQAPEKRTSTELGHGVIDYKPIFAEARKVGIAYAIVEQEDFDMPIPDALKIDFDFMKAAGLPTS
ncbi:MAG: sugar phosphate isomerase/epimerase [Silvibacterium sp.]|nr:sugar phosphate isomerase/epimerase [Silvibacterium sp.]